MSYLQGAPRLLYGGPAQVSAAQFAPGQSQPSLPPQMPPPPQLIGTSDSPRMPPQQPPPIQYPNPMQLQQMQQMRSAAPQSPQLPVYHPQINMSPGGSISGVPDMVGRMPSGNYGSGFARIRNLFGLS